jgi:release factor glutamine methyltransferase
LTPAPAAIALVAARLAAAGIEEPRREARIILAAAHGTDAAGLLARDALDEALYEPLVARRAAREPLAYILGHKEFWGLSLNVSSATLIPRPDSETLIEAALTLPAPARVLDLGTGTGCLLLALLHERPLAFGVGVDISPEAAALAAQNALNLGFVNRVAFLAGHWADALEGEFDLILSNPPYIPEADIAGLMPEVAAFEPASALAGGVDGFAAYRHIIRHLPRILAKNGAAILEVGVGQAPYVSGLAAQAGFACETRQDLSGIKRAVILTRRK